MSTDGRALGVVSIRDLVDPDRDARHREGYAVFYELKGGTSTELGPDLPDASAGRIADVMTAKVISIETSASVEDAARAMLEHEIHRLLVTKDGKLEGIASILDVVGGMLG